MKTKIKLIDIEDLEYPSTGIAHINGKKIKVKNTLPGQKLQVKLSRGKGRVVNIISKSDHEKEPICDVFYECGGCTYQNIDYSYEINLKEKVVLDLFKATNITNFKYLGIQGGEVTESITVPYRNKMEYSFGDEYKNGPTTIGLRKSNAYYEVINSKICNIVDCDFTTILFCVQNYFSNKDEVFYNKRLHVGALRHLVIRKGINTGEILVNLVTTSQIKEDLKDFSSQIKSINLKGKIVGILHTINDSVSDVVKSEKVNVLYGQDYYIENLMGLKFKVYPMSFFQTNTVGAAYLYSIVKNFVQDCGDVSVAYDLYCGTGTIAQILSNIVNHVYGIDISKDSIKAANENALLNNINNCHFYAGDVKDVINEISATPDVIIVDPPREGLTKKALKSVVDIGANHIIYVSCKPTSLVENIEDFIQFGYKIKKLKLLDMFPRTSHIEAICHLKKLEIC